MHGIEHVFGIIGSAFMPISDFFQRRHGVWDVAHETNGGMIGRRLHAHDRKIAMMHRTEQAGITNFVTAVKTAYWNHSPMLLVTPQAANKTIGQGGFQEVEQMALFRDIVCYQEEVRDPRPSTASITKAKRSVSARQIRAITGRKSSTSPAADREIPGRRRAGDHRSCRTPVGGEIAGHPVGRRRRARQCDPQCAALAEKLSAPLQRLPAQ